MRFRYATNNQRFLTYLIDFLIIEALLSGITAVIFKLMNFDVSMNDTILEQLMAEAVKALETGDMTNYFNYYMEFLKYSLVELGVQISCALLIVVGYFIVLPKLWKKQTVGRLVANTRVVMTDTNEPNLKALVLREFVGTFILYFCVGLIAYIITWVFVNKENRSLVDKISGTILVHNVLVAEEAPKQENNQSYQDDYIDAKFKEVEEPEVVEPKKNEPEADEDGYIVF